MTECEFPEVIKQIIVSYLPIKKRFEFDINKGCDLHYLCANIFLEPDVHPRNMIFLYLKFYYIKDNNYLQNINGNTPLHVAYQYGNSVAANIIKAHFPEMEEIKNANGKKPHEAYGPLYSLKRIHYPQETYDSETIYIALY